MYPSESVEGYHAAVSVEYVAENIELREEVLSGNYQVKPTIDFIINERGHTRQIEAPVVRDRRRLKAFRRMFDRGQMTEAEIYDAYQSWRGTVIIDHNACERSIRAMDRLYSSLFPPHQEQPKRSRKTLVMRANREAESEDLRYIV